MLFRSKLIPQWDEWKTGPIIVDNPDPRGFRLYGSYDHGWRTPSAYLIHGIDAEGNMVTFWELYGARIPVPDMARCIKGNPIVTLDGRSFPGNPYAGEEVMRLADATIWAENQQTSDNAYKSIAELYRRHGVNFIPGQRGGDITVAEWLLGDLWRDPQKPRYRISSACPNLIREIGLQRFKEYSDQVALTREQPDQLIDKDNHAWDCLKIFLLEFPPHAAKGAHRPVRDGSFRWWQKQTKRGTPSTFRIGQREMVQ